MSTGFVAFSIHFCLYRMLLYVPCSVFMGFDAFMHGSLMLLAEFLPCHCGGWSMPSDPAWHIAGAQQRVAA